MLALLGLGAAGWNHAQPWFNHWNGDGDDFFNAFLPMIPTINRFFETVLVMDENPTLRQNRLGLLQRIAALAGGVADFSLLEGF